MAKRNHQPPPPPPKPPHAADDETPPPQFQRLDQTSLLVTDFGGGGVGEYRGEERDDDEYFYVHPRPGSRASDSATINFLTDDRAAGTPDQRQQRPSVRQLRQHFDSGAEADSPPPEELYAEDRGHIRFTTTNGEESFPETSARREHTHHHRFARDPAGHRMPSSAVDYSSRDFHESRAIIADAAERAHQTSPSDRVRVKKVGDTTIVTEHRDPYSFYWQLDTLRRMEEEPPRRLPPADYVIDEEAEEEEVHEEEEFFEMPQTQVLSPDSHDSGVHVESHYARPVKPQEEHRSLPSSLEKREDPSRFSNYWHVDSGPREPEPPPRERPKIPVRHEPPPETSPPPPPLSEETQTEPPPAVVALPAQPVIEEHAFRQTTTKRRVEKRDETEAENGEQSAETRPFRFMVRSLGWMEVPEGELLSAESSQRAVNRAIADLSSKPEAKNKWDGGKELIMELDDNALRLLDPEDPRRIVHSERIQQIRVWGVGRENARDFAYVAREPGSRRFLCQVFRCDTPAKNITSALQQICSRLMQHSRPNSLGTGRRVKRESLLFTPTEEPKRVVRCHFIGVTQVPRATGIETLNEAVDRLVGQVQRDRWTLCDVQIAPSTITVVDASSGNRIAQCRVRYLSFLGIGQDIKHCAFIIATSSESFICYVFHVEPSAGPMAKTIEAACKLRYQKVMDAHLNTAGNSMNNPINGGLQRKHHIHDGRRHNNPQITTTFEQF